MRPEFTIEAAGDLAEAFYGISGNLKSLPSYSDQNFLVDTGQEKYILKIANDEEPAVVLDFQQQALAHAHHADPELDIPTVIPAQDGTLLNKLPGTAHHLWMVSFLPGAFVSDLKSHPPAFLYDLGAFLGKLDRALASFTHEGMHRDLQWDLKNAGQLEDFLHYIEDSSHRNLVARFLKRLDTHIAPLAGRLRQQVIHNDANDNNVLVHEPQNGIANVSGIIDFGDMVYTYTVGEIAIAAAYLILGKSKVLETAQQIVKGYHATFPLQSPELEVLFDLICLRLCTSVCMSARERKAAPDNVYLAVSEQPAWEALAILDRIDPNRAIDQFLAVKAR